VAMDKKSCICQPYVPLTSFRSPGSMDLPAFLSKQVRMTSEEKIDGLLTRERCLRPVLVAVPLIGIRRYYGSTIPHPLNIILVPKHKEEK
jgi:hypothetical protein